MKQFCLILTVFLLQAVAAWSQNVITVSGKVTDKSSGAALEAASVIADDNRSATVTNASGDFIIKGPAGTRYLTLSHLGYRSRQVAVPAEGRTLRVPLVPSAITLSEVLVADPEAVLRMAVRNIPANYAARPLGQRCFYRETTQKGRRFIYVAEAVTSMYKEAYTRGIARDRTTILKARRLVSTQASDTLGAKIAGGPFTPIVLDVMKNLGYLLNEEMMSQYTYSMRAVPGTDGRGQVVVTMSPRMLPRVVALLYGDFYIDTRTLAVTHVDLTLDMRDARLATAFMLRSKPAGVRFRPRSLEIYINYRPGHDGRLSLGYIRSDVSFKCEWKKKLFTAPYKVTSEMVVTDERTDTVASVRGKSAFSRHEALYDHPEYFDDPHFWEQYNIIAPTHSLEKGIKAFLKRNR